MSTATYETPLQTVVEEWLNAWSHGIGALLSIASLGLMLWTSFSRGMVLEIISCVVFGLSLVLLYGTSTLYHATRSPARKRLLRKCDHMMIYLLIAGSYTPFMLLTVGGIWGWSLFVIVWALAIGGLFFKFFFLDRFQKLSLMFYLGMGWLAILVVDKLYASLSVEGLLWLLGGGAMYSLGTLFYALDTRIRYFHAIWHLFVLMGSTCHVYAVLSHVLGYLQLRGYHACPSMVDGPKESHA